MKKNDIIEFEITDITGQGSGIGRVDGMAVFVPMTAVGDKITARILKVKKNYAFGKLESIIEESKMRIEPDCKCYSKCGGCAFRHITYEEELKIKEQRVYDALTRIGKINDYNMHPIIGCNTPNGYRNKSQIPIGKNKDNKVIMGFYGNHSHRIIDNDHCSLHPKEFDDIAEVFRTWITKYNIKVYDEITHKGLIRHLYIRYASKNEQILVCPVINGSDIPYKDELVRMLKDCSSKIVSIVLNINKEKTNVILGNKCVTIYGNDYITDELCGLNFNISPISFYQVNRSQTELLYSVAEQYAALTGSQLVIDLYCGAGTIGLSMAKKAKKVIGVEIIPQAIDNAKENAKINGISNAEFICSDSAAAAEMLLQKGITPDVVIIDPPRKGCSETVIDSIVKMSPKRVVYVSCDPETLARDLAIFDSKSYKICDVTPVDMFPRTAHVETVVLLSKH